MRQKRHCFDEGQAGETSLTNGANQFDRGAGDMLQTAALTDALTGLPNRLGLEARLEHVPLADGSITSVALLRVDQLQWINSSHGEDVGDAVLKVISVIIGRVLRQDHIIARISGEAFAVVLPRTRPLTALGMCDLARAQIGSRPLIVDRLALCVTVSGGVAQLRAGGLHDALDAAQSALLDARTGGRNQLRLAA